MARTFYRDKELNALFHDDEAVHKFEFRFKAKRKTWNKANELLSEMKMDKNMAFAEFVNFLQVKYNRSLAIAKYEGSFECFLRYGTNGLGRDFPLKFMVAISPKTIKYDKVKVLEIVYIDNNRVNVTYTISNRPESIRVTKKPVKSIDTIIMNAFFGVGKWTKDEGEIT